MKLSTVALLLSVFSLGILTVEANPVPEEAEISKSSDTIEARGCCQWYGCGSDGNKCCMWGIC
ncbi:hypothetical protein K7432_011043 [Basidiobolus ranarum]|uniref:Uncharacterized protein n=1 Tax=Basidiobolus ranarum TaxID=34480 RepID=A0ABR2VUI4_9FUNG